MYNQSTGGFQPTDVVSGSINDFWFTIGQYMPNIIAAIIVFAIGWIFGILLYRAVVEFIKFLRIDDLMRSSGLSDAAHEAGFRLDIGMFLGILVKWFIILAFLSVSLSILGLSRVTVFIEQVVLLYIPQIVVAALILILAAVIADLVKKIISGSARIAGAHQGANFAGTIAKWAIWILAVLAALEQLGVAVALIQTLFTGLVVALSIAFGLAFGLGGKEAAARAIDRIWSEFSHTQK
jgi:hypothetical protein